MHPELDRHITHKATSGFIHLSDKHIFTVFTSCEEDGRVSLSVGAKLSASFLAATDALFEYLGGWTHTKIAAADNSRAPRTNRGG